MASIKRPAHNVEEWIQLTNPDKLRNERIVETSNILLSTLADWELKDLMAEQENTQNNPATTPEEGTTLQDKINRLICEGNTVFLWLNMSDAERMIVCRAFDRKNYFNGHLMSKQLLERPWKLEKAERRNSEALRTYHQVFVD
ncbi:hypothetical protein LCI18_003900 [Fusarium solani-melongenae]|uniref:Uncharacterized protein n=1 Tax=Fusarium solani subsp. cucurbitae TaxID=2747967 RepID=A0ACD3YVQ1_FUSSC|nr:hypothetical protein LCI18_003900 [Fusarium solani-melongenae]